MEDCEESKAHAKKSDQGEEPEDTGGRGPAEYEESRSKEDGAEHHWGESGFRDGAVVVLSEFFEVEFVVALSLLVLDLGVGSK